MEWSGRVEWWNGAVEWSGRVEWWNGVVEWSGRVEWWSGLTTLVRSQYALHGVSRGVFTAALVTHHAALAQVKVVADQTLETFSAEILRHAKVARYSCVTESTRLPTC